MPCLRLNLVLLFLGLGLAVLVPLLTQRVLWDSYSIEAGTLVDLDRRIQAFAPGDILVVGDSTVTVIAQNAPPTPGFTLLGVGGSGSELWRYLLLRAVEAGAKPRHVVFAATSLANFKGMNGNSTLQPFLMEFRGVREAYGSGELSLEKAIRYSFYLLLPLTRANEIVQSRLIAPWAPDLGQWVFLNQPGSKPPSPPPDPAATSLERLTHFLAERGLPAHFVISPAAARMRSV